MCLLVQLKGLLLKAYGTNIFNFFDLFVISKEIDATPIILSLVRMITSVPTRLFQTMKYVARGDDDQGR